MIRIYKPDGTFEILNLASSGGGAGTVTSIATTAPIQGGTITTSGTISITQANTSTDGYLSSTDWNTFNSKQPAGSYLTAVTADAPLSGSGTSGSHLLISKADTSTNGYLSSTDWNTFNGKQALLVSGTNIKTINGSSILGSGDLTVSGGANTALSNLASVAINTDLLLGTSDGGALGSGTKMWSDLFLASGGVINWNNGNVTLTHSAGKLTLAGDLSVTKLIASSIRGSASPLAFRNVADSADVMLMYDGGLRVNSFLGVNTASVVGTEIFRCNGEGYFDNRVKTAQYFWSSRAGLPGFYLTDTGGANRTWGVFVDASGNLLYGTFTNSLSSEVDKFYWTRAGGAVFGGTTFHASESFRFVTGDIYTDGKIGVVIDPTAYVDIAASTTANASLRLRSGVAPTSPNDGDIWFDGSSIYIRISGSTKTFTVT